MGFIDSLRGVGDRIFSGIGSALSGIGQIGGQILRDVGPAFVEQAAVVGINVLGQKLNRALGGSRQPTMAIPPPITVFRQPTQTPFVLPGGARAPTTGPIVSRGAIDALRGQISGPAVEPEFPLLGLSSPGALTRKQLARREFERQSTQPDELLRLIQASRLNTQPSAGPAGAPSGTIGRFAGPSFAIPSGGQSPVGVFVTSQTGFQQAGVGGALLPALRAGGQFIQRQIPGLLGGAALAAGLDVAQQAAVGVPGGGGIPTSPFKQNASGTVTASRIFVTSNPATGNLTWFRHAGAPQFKALRATGRRRRCPHHHHRRKR